MPTELDKLLDELDSDAVRRKFSAQFEAAENLQRYAWSHRPRGDTGGKPFRHIIFAIFARATLTYRAVLHLCRAGYTEQADMLNRSLFEDMVYTLWTSLPDHQKESLGLLEEQHQYSRLLAKDSIEKHKAWLNVEPGELPEELEQRRAALAKKFGTFGERPWTGANLHSMLEEIQTLWPDEESANVELWGFYSLGHRVNNQKLHNTALAINNAAKKSELDKDGKLIARLGASPTDGELPMIRAIYGAMFTYYWITRQVVIETAADAEECGTFYARQLDLLQKLAPSVRPQIGRNDPCPCGSGVKYKNCHR